MSVHREQKWTPEEDARLRDLWIADELSISAIGNRLGRSKNAITGRALRIGLPRKESPIVRTGPVKKGTVEIPWHVRQEAVRLPPLASVAMPAPHDIERRTAQSAAYEMVPQVVDYLALLIPRPRVCQWPMWGNGKPTQVYCSAELAPGRSYCSAHCQVAYVSVAKLAA